MSRCKELHSQKAGLTVLTRRKVYNRDHYDRGRRRRRGIFLRQRETTFLSPNFAFTSVQHFTREVFVEKKMEKFVC